MGKRVISTVAVTAALMLGGAFSAHAVPAGAEGKSVVAAASDHAAEMEKYNRKLADYRKDMAAYEADPNEWTAEIPRMQEKPAGAGQETEKR